VARKKSKVTAGGLAVGRGEEVTQSLDVEGLTTGGTKGEREEKEGAR